MKKIKELYLKYTELISYVFIGGLTTVVSLGSYFVCVVTILDPKNTLELQIANIISWVCSVIFAYFGNRIFVFKSKELNKIKEFIKFVCSRITTLLIDMAVMFLLVSVFNINDKISKLLVQFIVLVSNYIFSKLFVFKKNNFI